MLVSLAPASPELAALESSAVESRVALSASDAGAESIVSGSSMPKIAVHPAADRALTAIRPVTTRATEAEKNRMLGCVHLSAAEPEVKVGRPKYAARETSSVRPSWIRLLRDGHLPASDGQLIGPHCAVFLECR